MEQKGKKEAAADRKKKQQAAVTAVTTPADTQTPSNSNTVIAEPMETANNGGI